MAGRKQHRFPAARIGEFGTGDCRARDKKVWVRRRGAVELLHLPAGSLNIDKGAFDSPIGDSRVNIDTVWDNYESRAGVAIEAFASGGRIPPWDVLKGLIPLIAAATVRSPNFDRWFEETQTELIEASGLPVKEATNSARVALIPPIAALLLRAEWAVLDAPPDARFIANDLGHSAGFVDDQPLLLVPLRPNLAVQIRPIRDGSGVPLWNESTDPPPRSLYFTRMDLQAEAVTAINHFVAGDAIREIYGRERGDVEAIPLTGEPTVLPQIAAGLLAGPDGAFDLEDHYWINEMARQEEKMSRNVPVVQVQSRKPPNPT